MDYVVVEIGARQYLMEPNQVVEVDKIKEAKSFSSDKVLLLSEKGKIEVGKPYLKKTVNFEVLGEVKKPKIRVATYKAKANYRRVKGQRRVVAKIRLVGNA